MEDQALKWWHVRWGLAALQQYGRGFILRVLWHKLAGARIAREFAVNANQVFGWRRLYKQGLLAERGSEKLLPVCGTGEAKNGALCEGDLRGRAAGAIHIEFPGRALVTVEGCPSAESLRIVLESMLR